MPWQTATATAAVFDDINQCIFNQNKISLIFIVAQPLIHAFIGNKLSHRINDDPSFAFASHRDQWVSIVSHFQVDSWREEAVQRYRKKNDYFISFGNDFHITVKMAEMNPVQVIRLVIGEGAIIKAYKLIKNTFSACTPFTQSFEGVDGTYEMLLWTVTVDAWHIWRTVKMFIIFTSAICAELNTNVNQFYCLIKRFMSTAFWTK